MTKNSGKQEKHLNKNEKAVATNNGYKPFDYLDDNQNLVLSFNYDKSVNDLQEIIEVLIREQKVIRIYRCLCCEKNFGAEIMRNFLVICKSCYSVITALEKGNVARNNSIENTLNNYHKFLRRRVKI